MALPQGASKYQFFTAFLKNMRKTIEKNWYFICFCKNIVKNWYNWSNWYFEGDPGTSQLRAGGQTGILKWIQGRLSSTLEVKLVF